MILNRDKESYFETIKKGGLHTTGKKRLPMFLYLPYQIESEVLVILRSGEKGKHEMQYWMTILDHHFIRSLQQMMSDQYLYRQSRL